MIKNGFSKNNISAYDVSEKAAEAFKNITGINVALNNPKSFIEQADIVIIAVKPQYCESALNNHQNQTTEKLIISIAAGITIAKLQELTGSNRIIRVMPNTPALIGEGASAFSCSKAVTATDKENCLKVLNSIGCAIETSEEKINAVTGLSGSGPAYVFDFIQGLINGAVMIGLTHEEATKLAVQTVKGAAMLIEQTGNHPAQLRDMVTSPGGTTAAALNHLDNKAFKGTVADAVKSAKEKADKLSGL